ncbi:MAG: type II secretion system protein GspE, partial [Deltaproteobacteria bacterium]
MPADAMARSPAMRLLDAYLDLAASTGASDLHLEPGENGLLVRMRVDGRLRRLEPPPPALIDALRTRARLLAGVDLADRRVPQDGRFEFRAGNRTIDVRAAFIPVYGGEKITLRLLDRSGPGLSLDELGLTAEQAAALRRATAASGGMIVVCGPTGAGKT